MKRKRNDGTKEALVKWKGYNNDSNSWIPESYIQKLNVTDAYTWKTHGYKRYNNTLLPSNIRVLIIGKSNCGKTTLLLNLLLQPHWLDYDHLYVFGKSLHLQEFQILKRGYETGLSKSLVANIFHNQEVLVKVQLSPQETIEKYTGIKRGSIKANFYGDCTMIPDPSELDVVQKDLLILDDCFLGSQNKVEAYCTRGRHNNCDTFSISQNYFRLPRQTIRENANFIILFPQDANNLMHIHTDHCDDDMSLQEFTDYYQKVWNVGNHNFVTIDLTSGKLNGKYRKNLDCFYLPHI